MNLSTYEFSAVHLHGDELRGQRVLEVGAQSYNGGLRPFVMSRDPAEYVGVDISPGPGVDLVCDIADLEKRFGADSFDVVLCTEVLEHVRPWRDAIRNLKAVCRPGGFILLTTRSPGFPYHAYPHDYWRFDLGDFERIWSDFGIDTLESDPLAPGVYVKAHKPEHFVEADLSDLAVYCLPAGERALEVREEHLRSAHFRRLRWRDRLQRALTSIKAALFGKLTTSS